ncbi:MAG: protein adenylyltransferase SelO [bacterium]
MTTPPPTPDLPTLPPAGFALRSTYTELPEALYQHVSPTPVASPQVVLLNRALAAHLGLNLAALAEPQLAALFAGNALPAGCRPFAQAYAGHQYGRFTFLGDGRASVLGEQPAADGSLMDIQLKGAGPTRYSRRGDGRAALGPMLREYLISEAMHALGIPTTRSLAVAATGEPVMRQQALPGAVLTRVAASHLRVGTFQFAAVKDQGAHLAALVDYALHRHFPHLLAEPDPAQRTLHMLREIAARQARLLALWQSVGFIHGVMNTDNMAISGETIDYGPCAFMDVYHPDTVFSSIDHGGRYAYAQQPPIAQWNLARLAEALLPLLDPNPDRAVEHATQAVHDFQPAFITAYRNTMALKLGITRQRHADIQPDADLLADLLAAMQQARADFTATFRALADWADSASPAPAWIAPWLPRWHARLAAQPGGTAAARQVMLAANPAIIPRNHLVEAALTAAEQHADFGPFFTLLLTVQRPFHATAADAHFTTPPPPPPPGACGYRTFCGT